MVGNLARYIVKKGVELIKKLVGITPEPIRSTLKAFGVSGFLNRLLRLAHSKVYDKYDAELLYQRKWAKEYEENKSRVLEYWKEYRYLEDICAICKFTEDTKSLDVGCGISTVLHYIKGKRFGIDPLADEYLKLYEYPEELDIRKATGEDIPFPSECFDVVFCTNVLDHTTDPEKVVQEIYRVLKPKGHFVLAVEIFEEETRRDPAHPHSFTKRDVYSLLEGKFEPEFEKESIWIGERKYVKGLRKSHRKELIIVLKKV